MVDIQHPRYRHIPYHQDYVDLAVEFRPFVMGVHQPLYQSKTVNTDAIGLREQYDWEGRLIDLHTAREVYPSCNVLIGGSTAFGVDALSDKATLASHLNQPERPCINLGIRGALSQQEMVAFHLFKRFLPPIHHIVLLTGVNNISFASLSDTLFYPDVGGVFSEQYYYNQFHEQLTDQYQQFWQRDAQWTKREFFKWLDHRIYKRFPLLEALIKPMLTKTPLAQTPEKPSMTFEKKLDLVNQYLANDLETWACWQAGLGTQVHFVLQPAIHWTQKPLTPVEQACFNADLERIPSMGLYTQPNVYHTYQHTLANLCQQFDIAFYDANLWFNAPEYQSLSLFSDVCHLTSEGYEVLAREIRQHVPLGQLPLKEALCC
jgi:hypothetical protein